MLCFDKDKAQSGSLAQTWRKRFFSASILVTSLLSVQALAVDDAEITRLLRAGKHNDALNMVREGLHANPLHPQLRFMEGVIFAEQKRTQDAIAVFLKLSEDHPDLPEPYNNLAVLYSRDNQFEKARAALNMAIRAYPNYATAHENLGDVYTRMAAQSYGKALNLNSESISIPSKLKVLTALGISKPALLTPDKPNALGAPTATTVAAAPVPGNQPAPAIAKSQAPVAAAATNVGAGKAHAATQTAAPSAEEAVLSVVDVWASAWQSKNMDAYLDAYDKDYVGNDAKTHQQWVTMRKLRILGKDSIDVSIEKPVVELKGDTAIVSFRQLYTSGTVHSDGMKTLTLEKKSGLWKITKEVSEV